MCCLTSRPSHPLALISSPPMGRPFLLGERSPLLYSSAILATVPFPILGADFLPHHHLVDPHNHQVPRSADLQPLPASSTSAPPSPPFVAHLQTMALPIWYLIAEFPTVFNSGIQASKPTHGVQHHIQTTRPPVFTKARRLDADHLRTAMAEFAKLEAAGVIRCSDSPWSSTLHLVPKPNSTWRPCGDYRRLNLATVPDRHPLPNLHDFSSSHSYDIYRRRRLRPGPHSSMNHPLWCPPPTSPLIVAPSSPLPSGPISASTSTSPTILPQRTIPRPTV